MLLHPGMMASLARAAQRWRWRFAAIERSITPWEIPAAPPRRLGKYLYGHWDTIDPKAVPQLLRPETTARKWLFPQEKAALRLVLWGK
jgi:hypothetical protein